MLGSAMARITAATIAVLVLTFGIGLAVVAAMPKLATNSCTADTRGAANLVAAIQVHNPSAVSALQNANGSGTAPSVAATKGPGMPAVTLTYKAVPGDPRIAVNGTATGTGAGATTCAAGVTLTSRGLPSGTYTGK